MKILIIRPSPNKMSLESYNLQEVGLAKALTRKGHQCDVMYYCGKEKDHYEVIKFDDDSLQLRILWIHGYGIFREGIYPSLNKYIKEYDIVQIGGYTGITSTWLNKKFPEKTVNFQGPYFCKDNKGDNIKAKIFDRCLLPFSNKNNMIIGTKSELASIYMKEKGLKDVTTIGVGLDLDNILKISDDDMYENKFIKQIIKGKENKYLLYIGVLEERRNIHFILDVFKTLLEKMPGCKLVMIGKGKEKYVQSCFRYIKELDIEDNIIYTDRLEQKYIKAVYDVCDAFILPTKYEIFGMVLLEAMYFGLPVFTTYNGGSSTLMNKDNGIVIEEIDKKIWADKIYEILSDERKIQLLSKNAHNTIKEKYTWDALADNFINLYNKRLENN